MLQIIQFFLALNVKSSIIIILYPFGHKRYSFFYTYSAKIAS
jgi:hypothetical protein